MGLLTKEEQKQLILLVRKTIENQLFDKSDKEPNLNHQVFFEKKGAFVTIHKFNNLRGCIGIVEALHPLSELIEKMAISAAFRDPRFPPLSQEEYADIDIEISVLSETKEINDPHEIIIGKHGLIISDGTKKGLLLPQVAIEQNWGLEAFLNHTCIKAGLPKTKWREGAKIEVFEAEVFGEDDI